MHFSSAGGGGDFLPASSTKKTAPYGAKRSALAPGPWQTPMKNWGWASPKNMLDGLLRGGMMGIDRHGENLFVGETRENPDRLFPQWSFPDKMKMVFRLAPK